MVKKFKDKVEAEIEAICNEVTNIIDTKLLPATDKNEVKVFYHKMKGDYIRYFAKCTSGDKLKEMS